MSHERPSYASALKVVISLLLEPQFCAELRTSAKINTFTSSSLPLAEIALGLRSSKTSCDQFDTTRPFRVVPSALKERALSKDIRDHQKTRPRLHPMVAKEPFLLTWTAKKFQSTVINDIWPEVIFFTLVATSASFTTNSSDRI